MLEGTPPTGGPKTPDAARAWNVEGSRGVENRLLQSLLGKDEGVPSWECESV